MYDLYSRDDMNRPSKPCTSVEGVKASTCCANIGRGAQKAGSRPHGTVGGADELREVSTPNEFFFIEIIND